MPTRIRAAPIPIAIATITFFAFDWESGIAGVTWQGSGKYINLAVRCIFILCDVLYIIGSLKKSLVALMRPILYLFPIGVIYAFVLAICFYFGFDVNGNNQEIGKSSSIMDNTASDATGTEEPPKNQFPPLYSFCIVRTVVCFISWFFHYILYKQKIEKINRQENDRNERSDDLL